MSSSWLDRISPCIRPLRADEWMPSYTSHGEASPGWVEPLRIIYDHELVLFSKGRFVVEIEGQQYPCQAGTFIIVPPGKWHASWESSGQPGHRYWSHFDWVCQGPYGDTAIMTFHPATPRSKDCRRAPRFVPRRIFHGDIHSPQRVYELAERLSSLQVRTNEHDRFVSRALLLELLLELLDTRSRTAMVADGEAGLAHQVRALLEKNLAKHSSLRIQDLMAEQLGYSYAHLGRMFRAKYGISPVKYINVVCVARAKLLLRDTNLPIATIACQLGYKDPLYFSQLFRKTTGVQPSSYRRQVQQ